MRNWRELDYRELPWGAKPLRTGGREHTHTHTHCYFVKLKHLNCPHHRLIIHLHHLCRKCQSNGREHRATVDDGGVRIEGTGALRWLMTSTMNKTRQNHLTTLVQDLPAVCASCLPPPVSLLMIAYARLHRNWRGYLHSAPCGLLWHEGGLISWWFHHM